jgi:hypothetical protein
MIPKQHDEHANANDEQEFRKRLEAWAKTSGIEAKEWRVRQLQQEGKYPQAAQLRAEVMAAANTAARQIRRELNGTNSKKRA